MIVNRYSLRVAQVDAFAFVVRFDNDSFEPLRLDEPPPLGSDAAPNAPRILAAAIGNCLAASLVFCLKVGGVAVVGVDADVDVEIIRTKAKRLRIGRVRVNLRAPLAVDDPVLVACTKSFEEFCVVTQSVRDGIDVTVRVKGDLSPRGSS
jgi:uncharacterized OsmC-like protein